MQPPPGHQLHQPRPQVQGPPAGLGTPDATRVFGRRHGEIVPVMPGDCRGDEILERPRRRRGRVVALEGERFVAVFEPCLVGPVKPVVDLVAGGLDLILAAVREIRRVPAAQHVADESGPRVPAISDAMGDVQLFVDPVVGVDVNVEEREGAQPDRADRVGGVGEGRGLPAPVLLQRPQERAMHCCQQEIVPGKKLPRPLDDVLPLHLAPGRGAFRRGGEGFIEVENPVEGGGDEPPLVAAAAPPC